MEKAIETKSTKTRGYNSAPLTLVSRTRSKLFLDRGGEPICFFISYEDCAGSVVVGNMVGPATFQLRVRKLKRRSLSETKGKLKLRIRWSVGSRSLDDRRIECLAGIIHISAHERCVKIEDPHRHAILSPNETHCCLEKILS